MAGCFMAGCFTTLTPDVLSIAVCGNGHGAKALFDFSVQRSWSDLQDVAF